MAEQPHNPLPVSNLADFRLVPGAEPPEVETFDYSKASSFEIALSVMDDAANRLACMVAQKISRDPDDTGKAVYVIAGSNPKVCKIGVAKDPTDRLASLQTAHWDDLRIVALFWVYGSHTALERAALNFAKSEGLRLRGEWVAVSAEEAAMMLADVASERGTICANSEMWLRNRHRAGKNVERTRAERQAAYPEFDIRMRQCGYYPPLLVA